MRARVRVRVRVWARVRVRRAEHAAKRWRMPSMRSSIDFENFSLSRCRLATHRSKSARSGSSPSGLALSGSSPKAAKKNSSSPTQPV
eukprot:scaffold19964_cov31-Phaeocystis_antarctica.AAC.1